MVMEMVKNKSMARLYVSCNHFCTRYFLVKILLVKSKDLHASAFVKLNYGTATQKPKM